MDLYRLLATSTDPWSISQLVTTVIPTVDGPGISASAIGITALVNCLWPEWCRLSGQDPDYWPASHKLQAV